MSCIIVAEGKVVNESRSHPHPFMVSVGFARAVGLSSFYWVFTPFCIFFFWEFVLFLGGLLSPLYLGVSFAYNTHLQVTLNNQKMRTKGARKILARTVISLRTGPYVCEYIVMEKEHSKRKTGQRVFMHNVPWFTIETQAGDLIATFLFTSMAFSIQTDRMSFFFFVLVMRQSELIPPPVPHIRRWSRYIKQLRDPWPSPYDKQLHWNGPHRVQINEPKEEFDCTMDPNLHLN